MCVRREAGDVVVLGGFCTQPVTIFNEQNLKQDCMSSLQHFRTERTCPVHGTERLTRARFPALPCSIRVQKTNKPNEPTGATLADAIARVDGNDRPNALAIERNRLPAMHTILNA